MASEMGNWGSELVLRHRRKVCGAEAEDSHGEKMKMTEKNVKIEEDENPVPIF